jgi:hypothetical protein
VIALSDLVVSALQNHPAVQSVHLVGSRQARTAGLLSDWDFAVEVTDFATVSVTLPKLVAPLHPLVQQWDPLSTHQSYMLILPGPAKVDLLFDRPHQPQPPWDVRADTLQDIDNHFWDWLYWLCSKQLAGKHSVVAEEFTKMARHLLSPLGAASVPKTVEQAVSLYVEARETAEGRHTMAVSRHLEREIRVGLRAVGDDL